jgi:hypothetical protein
MTGYPQHNYPAFHAAAARIRARGFECVNPAEVNPDTEVLGKDAPSAALWKHCMVRDIPHLLTCDAVAVLPGWKQSRGARLEVYIAASLGLPVIEEETWRTITEPAKARAKLLAAAEGHDLTQRRHDATFLQKGFLC